MKNLAIKYNPDCSHLLNEANDCIGLFKSIHLKENKIGILNGVLWVIKSKKEFQIYVYHTKTQIICDIRVNKQ